ncbi:MAG: DUF998 domain-containing protein [Burkholderiaceae bacterium]
MSIGARWAFPFAVLGAGAVLLLTLLGAAGFPGYSHESQFISELGTRGAPHERWVRFAGFLPAGIFVILFAAAAFDGLPRSRLTSAGLLGLVVYALGYVAAAFFPCDAGCRPAQPSVSQAIHNAVGLAGYALAPLFMYALGWQARRWPGATYLAALGFVAAALVLVGLLTLSPKSPFAGISQRVIEVAVLSWVLLCGVYLRSRASPAA